MFRNDLIGSKKYYLMGRGIYRYTLCNKILKFDQNVIRVGVQLG